MGLSFALSVRGASGGDHRFLAGGASGSRLARSPGARSQAHLCQYCPRTWRNRADHRPVAGARESGDHAQIHQLRRCGGPRGGRCRLVRPAKGLSHGKEDQSDRYEDRQAGKPGMSSTPFGTPALPGSGSGSGRRGGRATCITATRKADRGSSRLDRWRSGASTRPGANAWRSGTGCIRGSGWKAPTARRLHCSGTSSRDRGERRVMSPVNHRQRRQKTGL